MQESSTNQSYDPAEALADAQDSLSFIKQRAALPLSVVALSAGTTALIVLAIGLGWPGWWLAAVCILAVAVEFALTARQASRTGIGLGAKELADVPRWAVGLVLLLLFACLVGAAFAQFNDATWAAWVSALAFFAIYFGSVAKLSRNLSGNQKRRGELR